MADNIYAKVDTEVANILTDIGPTTATGGSATSGTVMAKLNKLINISGIESFYRPDEYLLVDNSNVETITMLSSEISVSGGGSKSIGTLTIPKDVSFIRVRATMKTSTTGFSAEIKLSATGLSEIRACYVGSTSYAETTSRNILANEVAGKTINLNLIQSGPSSVTSYCNKVEVDIVRYNKVTSQEKYLMNTVKKVMVNKTASDISIGVAVRLDRCEFDYFNSGTSQGPTFFTLDNVEYIEFAPPYCIMRIKY